MIKIKLRRVTHITLILFIICAMTLYCFAGSDGSPEGYDSWDDFLMGKPSSEKVSDYIPETGEMTLVSSRNGFELRFLESENIIYLHETATGKIWSNIIRHNKTSEKKLTDFDARGLFSISTVNKKNAIETFEILSTAGQDSSVKSEIKNNEIFLNVNLIEAEISFKANLGLDEKGFYCTVSGDSINEKGDNKLLSISLLPSFGAAPVDEDGYILYCDGSGAIIEFAGKNASARKKYSHQVWGSSTADLDNILLEEKQGIYPMMLPAFGIKHATGAILAAVTEGEELAEFNVIYDNFYSAGFIFNYRHFYNADYNFTGSVFDEKTISKLSGESLSESDVTVRWFLLPENKNTYNEMAAAYRSYLIETGILKPLQKRVTIPISLEILQGVVKSGLLGESVISLTSYTEAREILEDLSGRGVADAAVLLKGWSKGGVTASPTKNSRENKNGSGSSFNALKDYCEKNSLKLYFETELIKGNQSRGNFNKQKDVLRDCIKQIVEDKENKYRLLSPLKILEAYTTSLIKEKSSNICLASIGSLLLSAFDSSGEVSRSSALASYRRALGTLKKSKAYAAVQGGNSYTFPYTQQLYYIPEKDSGYYENSHSVPFYQMVVHGFIEYSSIAGNRSSDLTEQKLRWIETGTLPQFFITHDESTKLQDTDYNHIFSSRYSDYAEIIEATYKEFNERLSSVWYETIDRHEILSESAVRLTYGNGSRLLINYSAQTQTIDGTEVPPLDYILLEVS